MNKPTFKELYYLCIQKLTNFPYIEQDFDALTNYELLCKVVDYLKGVIKNDNIQNDAITALYNAFVTLKNYVDNYFDELNIQDIVDDVLDEMLENGTLESLLENTLNVLRIFNTEAELYDNLDNLVNGNIVKVLSKENLNDGGGYLIKINDESGDIDFQNGLYGSYIKNIMDNYYNEITYEKIRRYETDCYITTIPLNDSEGNQIVPYVAHNSINSPTKYARDNYTTLTINASANVTNTLDPNLSGIPIIIGNGNVLHNNPMISEGVADNILYLGIKADRSFMEFKVNETSLQRLQENNLINVFDVYYKLIENSVALDLSNVSVAGSNTIVTKPNPRQCIGLKDDGTIIILTCDGRITNNIGLTSAETQQILLDYGCVNAWNLDGGGSASTTIKGCKINRNIDGNGTIDRDIPYTLNFKRRTVNEEISKIYSFIGKQKQDIIASLLEYGVQYKSLTSEDCDELIGNVFIGYGNGMKNTPYNPTPKAGYFINIPHSGSSNPEFMLLYNKQFFIERDTNEIYTRSQVNGVFNNWQMLNNETILYNSGNIIISGTDVNSLPLKIQGTNTNVVGVAETSPETSKYIDFKINNLTHITIRGYLNLVPKSADGDRYLYIYKNGVSVESIRINEQVDKADQIYFETFLNVDNVDNIYSIKFKGQNNDAILRARAFIELK